jgi:antitoxin VapB
MAISIRNPRVEKLARTLAKRQGITMTDAIAKALEAQVSSQKENYKSIRESLALIAAECAALPDLDKRSADEILGYGKSGGFIDGNR